MVCGLTILNKNKPLLLLEAYLQDVIGNKDTFLYCSKRKAITLPKRFFAVKVFPFQGFHSAWWPQNKVGKILESGGHWPFRDSSCWKYLRFSEQPCKCPGLPHPGKVLNFFCCFGKSLNFIFKSWKMFTTFLRDLPRQNVKLLNFIITGTL